jgi:uncharacterized protein YecE (DUF72 family)
MLGSQIVKQQRPKHETEAQGSLFAPVPAVQEPSAPATHRGAEDGAHPGPVLTQHHGIRMGTSSFTADGWESSFYPRTVRQADRLAYYASQYNTVEIDSTFYGTPAETTVQRWAARTPPGFVFAAKIPQIITHEKILRDCDTELAEFLSVMDHLGDKLGPLLFQFGYFGDGVFRTLTDFLTRLEPFLVKLPPGYKFAIEIRNQHWLVPRFTDLLRQHNVALALIDHSWMPRPWEIDANLDLATSDWTYVRWLGDRKEIEAVTNNRWDKTVVDRETDLTNWAEVFRQFLGRKLKIYAYANNHYSGYGPGTIKLFWNLFEEGRTSKP